MSEVLTRELRTVVCPIFAKFRSTDPGVVTVSALFPGLGRGKLNALCDRGEVRRRKTGEGPSDGVLYRIEDIVEWMEEGGGDRG
jgi:hypothetical protein